MGRLCPSHPLMVRSFPTWFYKTKVPGLLHRSHVPLLPIEKLAVKTQKNWIQINVLPVNGQGAAGASGAAFRDLGGDSQHSHLPTPVPTGSGPKTLLLENHAHAERNGH